jgi:hypothetical protein
MNTEITVSIPQFHAIQASTIEQYLNENAQNGGKYGIDFAQNKRANRK